MDFLDKSVKAQWYQFLPDKAVGAIENDWECGFV